MTNSEMLDAISKLQAMGLAMGRDRDDAYGMYWQAADLGWALMQATGIAAVTREQFEEKQERLFEMGWDMLRRNDKQKPVADEWPEVLE